ncbi:MAG: hypothetical protein ACOYL6_07830 [Bacteriovoracaceae bacterium]
MREAIQNEALINEYKGNLFEFLVAQKIAQYFDLEAQFLTDLLPLYKEKLVLYENEIKKLDSVLYRHLPKLAEKTFSALLEKLPFKPQRIFLVGKVAKSSAHDLDASDVLLMSPLNELLGLSLKLGKDQSFVNTKSGGVKSFLKEYFAHPEANKMQEELNQKLTMHYQNFAHALYQLVDLDPFDDFKSWRAQHLTELPGELEGEAREVLLQYYNQCIKDFYTKLNFFQKSDPKLFKESILKLLGFSDKKMIQVLTAHVDHQFKAVKLICSEDFDQTEFTFKEKSLDDLQTSSFHLVSDQLTLQIRMKPMNVFTTASMKVNCSVKYRQLL